MRIKCTLQKSDVLCFQPLLSFVPTVFNISRSAGFQPPFEGKSTLPVGQSLPVVIGQRPAQANESPPSPPRKRGSKPEGVDSRFRGNDVPRGTFESPKLRDARAPRFPPGGQVRTVLHPPRPPARTCATSKSPILALKVRIKHSIWVRFSFVFSFVPTCPSLFSIR